MDIRKWFSPDGGVASKPSEDDDTMPGTSTGADKDRLRQIQKVWKMNQDTANWKKVMPSQMTLQQITQIRLQPTVIKDVLSALTDMGDT